MDDALVRYAWLRYFHKKQRHVPILLQKAPGIKTKTLLKMGIHTIYGIELPK